MKILLKHWWIILAIFLVLCGVIFFFSKMATYLKVPTNSNTIKSNTINSSSKVELTNTSSVETVASSSKVISPPPVIKGALLVDVSFLIKQDYTINDLIDIDANRIMVIANKNKDTKTFIYNIEKNSFSDLVIKINNTEFYPDNITLLNDGRFFSFIDLDEKGLILNKDFSVAKEIIFPKINGSCGFKISPNGEYFSFREEDGANAGMYVTDIGFTKIILLLKDPKINTNDKNPKRYVPTYWSLDGERIIYVLNGYEWTEYPGIISYDGIKNVTFEKELKSMFLSTDNTGKLYYNLDMAGPFGQLGIFDEKTSKKTVILSAVTDELTYPIISINGDYLGYSKKISDNSSISYVFSVKLNKIIKTIADSKLTVARSCFTSDDKYYFFTMNGSGGGNDFPTYLYMMDLTK
jgi:hypothetical protein